MDHRSARSEPMRFARPLSTVALALTVLAGCGGSSNPVGPATGVYKGQSAAGNAVLGIVLSDGRYYFIYTPPSAPTLVNLVNSGSGSSSNGTFSSGALLSVAMSQGGYSLTDKIASGTLSATYVPDKSFDGTVTYSSGGGSSFPLTFVPGSLTAATAAQVAGTYSGTFSFDNNRGVITNYYTWKPDSTFTVSAGGSLSGTVTCWTTPACTAAPCPTGSCNATGTLTPRSDVAAYDLQLTFAGTGPGFTTPMDGSYSGIAYLDAGALYLAAVSPTTNHAIGFK